MKTPSIKLSISTPMLAAFFMTSAHAVPPLPPKTTTNFQNVADTYGGSAAGTVGNFVWNNGTPTSFASLGLPVIAQTTFAERVYAVTCRAVLVPSLITATNDEAVIGNGGNYSLTGGPGLVPQPLLTESDPVPGSLNSIGVAGQIATGSTASNPSVERLQVSSAGLVACKTHSSIGGGAKFNLTANNTILNLGETISPFVNQSPVVVDDMSTRYAVREQHLGPITAMLKAQALPGGFGLPMNPLPLPTSTFCMQSTLPTVLGGSWAATQGAWNRPASPAISDRGIVAFHCIDNVGPFYTRPQIRLCAPGGGQQIVMRQGTPCPANPMGATHFGVVNASLMALNIGGGTSPNFGNTIAWHMTNMRTAPNAGIINQSSLWCKQGAVTAYVAHTGAAAPGILGYNFNGFYALHVASQPGAPSVANIIFGANLSPGGAPLKRAIYTCQVIGGAVGPLTLIATNVPGITPALPIAGPLTDINVFGIGGSGHLFSVSNHGEVLFKATLANTLPPAQRQVLVVASPATGYALEVWAQSGVSTFVNSLGITVPFSNFTLTQPEQGTFSRGQAIATLPGALGTSLAFRGHAGLNKATIIAW